MKDYPRNALTLMIVALALATGPVKAGLLTKVEVTVTDLGGSFGYEYTLTNLAASDVPAIAFRVDVDASANLQSIAGATGWDVSYVVGDSFITWSSSDESVDLLPGDSLLFSFTSVVGPRDVDYSVLGFDGASFDFNQGKTLGPALSSVPEPSSLWLAALAGPGCYLVMLRERCRRSAPARACGGAGE
jgi:hypothetical protein